MSDVFLKKNIFILKPHIKGPHTVFRQTFRILLLPMHQPLFIFDFMVVVGCFFIFKWFYWTILDLFSFFGCVYMCFSVIRCFFQICVVEIFRGETWIIQLSFLKSNEFIFSLSKIRSYFVLPPPHPTPWSNPMSVRCNS